MKSFKIYIGIVLLALLMSSCSENNSGENSQSIYEKNFLNTYSAIDSKYRQAEGFNSCVESSLSSCYQRTVRTAAFDTKNVLICDDLEDESIKQECINSIISFSAREEKNIDGCASIEGNEQVSCKYSIITEKAIVEGDIEVCNEIKAHNEVSEEINEFYTKAKKDCTYNLYSNLAVVEEDSALCNKIGDRGTRQNCIEQVQSIIASKEVVEIIEEKTEVPVVSEEGENITETLSGAVLGTQETNELSENKIQSE